MSSKLSSRLNGLMHNAPKDREVSVNLLMKRDLSPSEIDDAMQQVRSVAAADSDVEYIPITCSLHFRIPLGQLETIEAMSDVESIAVESNVPIEELLDS